MKAAIGKDVYSFNKVVVVRNETTGKVYEIRDGRCNCPDATYRNRRCKHVIALAFQEAIAQRQGLTLNVRISLD